ncbi:MAG: hypothetical protein KY453_04755 [Gemmatimonadetes bacterium]|nr:hypothetical protein [Gemmatimonadota bacterium]
MKLGAVGRSAGWATGLLALAAACGGEAPAPGDEVPAAGDAVPAADTALSAAGASVPGASERPATRTDTLLVEGMPEPVELRLVRSPDGFPLPFSTYAPAEFRVEQAMREGQPAVRFVAAFGGVRSEDAFVEIALYPAGGGQAAALERAALSMDPSAEPEILDGSGLGWAELGWRWRGGGADGPYVAHFLLGHHGERWFQVLRRYPPEYAEGFVPRAEVILESLRWGDG